MKHSDKVHYSDLQRQPDGMINDWINWGNSDSMDVLMNVFGVFDSVLAQCLKNNQGAWCPELLLKTMLDIFGIKTEKHKISVELPRF
jgi:hypothetical protein